MNRNKMLTGCLAVLSYCVSTIAMAGPGLPAKPSLDPLTMGPLATIDAQATVGRIQLLHGQATIATPTANSKSTAASGASLSPDQVLQSGPDARVRVGLGNRDTIHLGPDSLLGLARQGDEWLVNLWQGTLTAYAIPRIEGRQSQLVIQTPQGQMSITAGKGAVTVTDSETTIAVFDNSVDWSDAETETRTLVSGQMGVIGTDSRKMTAIPAGLESKLTALTSPETPVVEAALDAFQTNDLQRAEQLFEQVQSAFPYNRVAPYYLGLIKLRDGELDGSIQQWRHYASVDPQGAEDKDVNRHLTLMVKQQLEIEIEKALANEAEIGNGPPEPNSIAVHPLSNLGDEAYRAIAKGLAAMVIADLAKVPGLKVLEREKVQRLLDEIELSRSGLVSEENAIRAGRILRAEKLIVGDYRIEPEASAAGGDPDE